MRGRAEGEPETPLYTFLSDGEEDSVEMSGGALDLQARKLGGALQERNLTGERAVLLYPPGLDYIAGFFGCLYGGVIAVPAYPPNPSQLERSLPRILSIIKNCQAQLILTTQEILSMAQFLSNQHPEFSQIQWLASDNLDGNYAENWETPSITRESIAFLQYTSGSTGNPRGVKLTHGNLIHNLGLIQKGFGITPKIDSGISWLPPYHDMGLIGGILEPLFVESHTYLMSPLHFLEKPLRWLKIFSKTKNPIVSGGPNFAYELCLRKISPEERDTLDLSNWKLAFTGAEPIRKDTLKHFANFFGPSGFSAKALYPCYGLAEATLIVSGNSRGEGYRTFSPQENNDSTDTPRNGNAVLVSCGRSFPDQIIKIVHPKKLIPMQEGEIGEVWVRGPSIAHGYWNHPQDEKEVFNNRLEHPDDQPYLRTGDLGFLHEGELFISGRLKDLIIIRGMNYYPQDLERSLESCHSSFRPGCCAAFSLPVAGEERLILVQELSKESFRNLETVKFAEALAKVKERIAQDHDLEVFALLLIPPSTLPKTSSGKISRHFSKLAFQENTLKPLFQWTKDIRETQRQTFDPQFKQELLKVDAEGRKSLILQRIRSRLSKILDVDLESLQPNQNLMSLGLDSLMMMELKSEIESSLGISLSVKKFLKPKMGLSDLSQSIAEQLSSSGVNL